MTNQIPEIMNINTHLVNEMERSLALLAGRWRSRQNTPDAESIARQYQAILRCMIELGYQDSLDVDSELPDELMPQEYFELFKQK
jgi:hypothetical protein